MYPPFEQLDTRLRRLLEALLTRPAAAPSRDDEREECEEAGA